MRKPLLLICLVCCLLLAGSTSLSAAANRQDTTDVSTAGWTISSWFAARLPGLILLPEPMQTNIFVDGPDPVESSQPKEDDSPAENPDDDDNTGGPTPFDSGGSGNISGSRD
jgi:hypothetical protein